MIEVAKHQSINATSTQIDTNDVERGLSKGKILVVWNCPVAVNLDTNTQPWHNAFHHTQSPRKDSLCRRNSVSIGLGIPKKNKPHPKHSSNRTLTNNYSPCHGVPCQIYVLAPSSVRWQCAMFLGSVAPTPQRNYRSIPNNPHLSIIPYIPYPTHYPYLWTLKEGEGEANQQAKRIQRPLCAPVSKESLIRITLP